MSDIHDSETPETAAHISEREIETAIGRGFCVSDDDFARELERERNKYQDIVFGIRNMLHCGHIDNVLDAVSKLNTRLQDMLALLATTELQRDAFRAELAAEKAAHAETARKLRGDLLRNICENTQSMNITTEQYDQLILKYCRTKLALAWNRTPGIWSWDGDPSNTDAKYREQNAPWLIQRNESSKSILKGDIYCPTIADALYITACSEVAEAGWRATIAAIEGCNNAMNTQYFKTAAGSQYIADTLANIRAFFPLSLIQEAQP